MGYELPDMPWAKNCRPLYALCIKGKEAEYRIVQGLKDSLSRLPKLPCASAGAPAIIKAVTKVLVNRTLEAHEPPGQRTTRTSGHVGPVTAGKEITQRWVPGWIWQSQESKRVKSTLPKGSVDFFVST